MTDGNVDDATYLVRVRAQVMARDDSSGGWVPMGTGGLSNVCVGKRNVDESSRREYVIYGRRITDQTVVLCCSINRDFQYNKVMPTFHHWRSGDKKFGLTFQTAADARAFDKVVRSAIDDITDGTGDYLHNHYKDEEVFMTLDLPVDSRSSSSSNGSGVVGCPSSTALNVPKDATSSSSSPYARSRSNYHHPHHRMHFIPSICTGNGVSSSDVSNENNSQTGEAPSRVTNEELWTKDKAYVNPDIDKIEVMSGESYSYVQFAKDKGRMEHEYSYPVMDSVKPHKQDTLSSITKHHLQVITTQPPLLPTKKKKECQRELHSPLTRLQCRHCLEMFSEEENQRGSCEYAPDEVLACISTSTCISCAQCMLYHCLSDAEGDFNHHHPCSCNGSDQHCHRHWIGLTLLSIFVPCLWCYLPLRACHSCCSSYGVCGGRHEAM
ncbi:sprouty-related, EVH1 domain-containing protein 2-like isoform X1 [Centruroides sculpturatus]|uniref:sprouty-related, EVH1 domain-containing protein 2-like isoform X1 n=2 Tax=Centruroides sculpturatus TaxID=218467 RepID=UPI000C6CA4E4|nr:sprouty-related, EVH1 domain-containing protein 2-like isoform X1 [Centruroides sculpturatus]